MKKTLAFSPRTRYNPYCASGCGSAWLERHLREVEVASSNPATPTNKNAENPVNIRVSAFFIFAGIQKVIKKVINNRIRRKGESCKSATKDKSTTNRFIFLRFFKIFSVNDFDTPHPLISGTKIQIKFFRNSSLILSRFALKNAFKTLPW